eukprot:s1296_g2.t1
MSVGAFVMLFHVVTACILGRFPIEASSGGEFCTLEADGLLREHDFHRGDAIVFPSHKPYRGKEKAQRGTDHKWPSICPDCGDLAGPPPWLRAPLRRGSRGYLRLRCHGQCPGEHAVPLCEIGLSAADRVPHPLHLLLGHRKFRAVPAGSEPEQVQEKGSYLEGRISDPHDR